MILEEAVSDDGDDIFLFDLFEVGSDLLPQGHSVLPLPHQLLNLLNVVLGPAVLVLLDKVDARAAVVLADVLDEIGPISNHLSFESVHEGASSLVEAVGATHLRIKFRS